MLQTAGDAAHDTIVIQLALNVPEEAAKAWKDTRQALEELLSEAATFTVSPSSGISSSSRTSIAAFSIPRLALGSAACCTVSLRSVKCSNSPVLTFNIVRENGASQTRKSLKQSWKWR